MSLPVHNLHIIYIGHNRTILQLHEFTVVYKSDKIGWAPLGLQATRHHRILPLPHIFIMSKLNRKQSVHHLHHILPVGCPAAMVCGPALVAGVLLVGLSSAEVKFRVFVSPERDT